MWYQLRYITTGGIFVFLNIQNVPEIVKIPKY